MNGECRQNPVCLLDAAYWMRLIGKAYWKGLSDKAYKPFFAYKADR